MSTPDRVPGWLWWGSWLLLGGVLITCLGGAVLLILGAADVPPVGPLIWEAAAVDGACLAVADLALPLLSAPTTLQLTATVDNSSVALTAWGVWFGSPEDGPRWEVLPSGYYRTGGQTMPFHHVGESVNTLRLDVVAGVARLWLNREVAHETTLREQPVAWGLLTSEAVCWRQITVYATD